MRKSELAAELGISKGRVSQLITAGLPVKPDGSLDREQALGWIAKYCSSHGGGHLVRGRRNIADVAAGLLKPSRPTKPHAKVAKMPAPPPAAEEPELDYIYDTLVAKEMSIDSMDEQYRCYGRLASAKAQEDFFRFCRYGVGVSTSEAFAIVRWFLFAALESAPAIIDIQKSISPPDWQALIGPSEDLEKVKEFSEKAMHRGCAELDRLDRESEAGR